MSINNVRRALDELDAVSTRDNLIVEVEKLQRQNTQLSQDNNQLRAEFHRLEDENSKLRAKANLKDAEIQMRAQSLANSQVSRWHAEEKPRVVASAIEEEIKGYPSNCTSSTKLVMDARISDAVIKRLSEGWTPILFAISNAIKASTLPVAIARPVVKATVISVSKPHEPDKKPSP